MTPADIAARAAAVAAEWTTEHLSEWRRYDPVGLTDVSEPLDAIEALLADRERLLSDRARLGAALVELRTDGRQVALEMGQSGHYVRLGIERGIAAVAAILDGGGA